MEYFVEICGHRSISKAAESLYISQQALSSCIAKLEKELGCALFVRTAKGISLTEEGEYVQRQFAPLVKRFRRLESEAMIHLAKQARKITLASAPLLFGVLDTSVLFTYREEHPQTQLDVVEIADADIERYVREDSANFGLLAASEVYLKNHFDYQIVRAYPIVLCVSQENPLSRRETVSFDDLKKEKFLMLDSHSLSYAATLEKAAECGFDPRIVFESSDVHQLCNLVNSNKGIVVGTYSPSFGTLYPHIRAVPFSDPDMQVCIAFVCQDRRKLDPAAMAFIDYVVQRETSALSM